MAKSPINILSTRKIGQRDIPLMFQDRERTYQVIDYGRRGIVEGGYSVVVRASSGQAIELFHDDKSQKWYVTQIIQQHTFA